MIDERHDGESENGGARPAGGEAPSPRAFAIGTGYVMQGVGFFLLLSACCFWSFSGYLFSAADPPAASWTEYLSGKHLPAGIVTGVVLVSLVGGIGLVAAGIGLQGERRTSGVVAVVTTVVMAAIYWLACGLLILKAGAWLPGTLSGLLGAVATILFLLSAHSAETLRRHPPPPDDPSEIEAVLDEHRKRRAERLEKYDP